MGRMDLEQIMGPQGAGNPCIKGTNEEGQKFVPEDINPHDFRGQVVIAERHSAQYLWIGTDIARLDAAMGEGRDGNPAIKINFFLTDRSYITVNIKRKGELVRRLYEHKRFKQGARTITWDMLDDTDNRVPAGEYEIEFVIEPTYSSYTYFEKEVSTSITLGD